MLDQEQICFLEALRLSMQGEKYALAVEDGAALRRIFHTASIQHVLPMVCEATCEAGCVQRCRSVFLPYKKRAVDEVVSQTVRTAQFLDLYRFLSERGLFPIVVKGLIIRRLYPRENLRISVDEDLLIRPEERMRYHEAVLAYGMQQMDPNQDAAVDPEIAYVDPDSGLYIEVHQYLLPPDSAAYGDLNRYFDQVQPVEVRHHGQRLLTLAPTDHVFFLICHSFKHFLHSGFGIRQICDLVMFSDVYADEIDWNGILKRCREFRADGFLKAVYRIGSRYLLPENRYDDYIGDWHTESVDEEPLLLDVLDSGVHGASDRSRLHSSTITLNAVAGQKRNGAAVGSVRSSIFPSLRDMKGRYRYLEKAPFLLPVAWLQRIIHYLRELSAGEAGNNSAADSIRLGKQRVELLKRYGIIK